MGSNLLYAVNATIPLFLVIALGFALNRAHMFNEGFLKATNKFNFKVTLPVLVFVDLATTDFKETFDLKFFLFCFIATSISFWGAWVIAKLVMRKKHKEDIGEFVQAAYRSSAAVLGLALIQNIYGSTNMAGMMMLGAVPLYNIYAVIVLQMESPEIQKNRISGSVSEETGNGIFSAKNGEMQRMIDSASSLSQNFEKDSSYNQYDGTGLNKKKSSSAEKELRNALLGIITNPIIIAIFLGLISSLIGIVYPTIIETALDYIARMASPLALVCIGADFNFTSAKEKLAPSVLAAVTKIIILPFVFVPIAILMGFGTEKLVAILVMLAAPTTPTTYVMAQNFGHSGTVSSSTVVITTLLSSVTLTGFIFILRTLGYI